MNLHTWFMHSCGIGTIQQESRASGVGNRRKWKAVNLWESIPGALAWAATILTAELQPLETKSSIYTPQVSA